MSDCLRVAVAASRRLRIRLVTMWGLSEFHTTSRDGGNIFCNSLIFIQESKQPKVDVGASQTFRPFFAMNSLGIEVFVVSLKNSE